MLPLSEKKKKKTYLFTKKDNGTRVLGPRDEGALFGEGSFGLTKQVLHAIKMFLL